MKLAVVLGACVSNNSMQNSPILELKQATELACVSDDKDNKPATNVIFKYGWMASISIKYQ